ncbi:UNVERIFIED_ORG: hypothetical protein M2328_006769 [Rhodococcus erythropolis]
MSTFTISESSTQLDQVDLVELEASGFNVEFLTDGQGIAPITAAGGCGGCCCFCCTCFGK